jgi:hypothetical protein
MIKKIVLLVIVIISVYGSFTAFKNGYVGIVNDKIELKYELPSYAQIQDDKSELDSKIKELKTLNASGIPNASGEVDTELKNYAQKKLIYEDLKATASREEIAEANKIRIYLLDYLWIKVGNYANDNAVKFKMTPNTEESTLSFDITGSYISVINFIYDIQNDEELNFKLDGIVIEGASSDIEVKAKFTVEDINVVTSPDEQIAEEVQ